MEEEVNQKTVALVVNASKITASVLRQAMQRAIQEGQYRHRQKVSQKKQVGKKGKMTVKQLVSQGSGVSNIEITDHNIKGFERTAKKYGIDFALKKELVDGKPRFLVFFRGRDTDVVNQAFKEFVGKEMKLKKKQPIKKKLEFFKQVVDKQIKKSKNKTKDMER